jgi:hypothetical protein
MAATIVMISRYFQTGRDGERQGEREREGGKDKGKKEQGERDREGREGEARLERECAYSQRTLTASLSRSSASATRFWPRLDSPLCTQAITLD